MFYNQDNAMALLNQNNHERISNRTELQVLNNKFWKLVYAEDTSNRTTNRTNNQGLRVDNASFYRKMHKLAQQLRNN